VQSAFSGWSPRPAYRWRNGLLRLFGASIHDKDAPTVRIFPSARIHFPWKLDLSAGVMIGPAVHVYNLGPIRLEAGVNISQHTHLCSGTS